MKSNSDILWIFCAVFGFVMLFGMLFSSLSYEEKIKIECRTTAMQKGYTAIEIQAICK